MTLSASLTAAGGTVDLVSAGSLTQTAGIITTSTLTGSSTAGGASLTRANLFDTLAGFIDTGAGNLSITDAKATGLTVTGGVDAGAGDTLTLTTTSGGPLTLAATLTAAGAAVDLVSAGALTQTAGIITTSTLTGSSTGGASLTDANLFDTLAGFTNSGAGSVSITDAQASGLTVTGVVDSGAGNTLTLTTAGGPLTLAANLTAVGGTVDLVSAGSLIQTAGVVTTGTLTGSATGGASLTGANLFDTLAGLTNTGAGAVSIVDAKASGLTVNTAVDAGTGNTLTLTTTNGGPLTLVANLTAAGGAVDLVAAGALTQTAGMITTATLTGSSSGGASLADANLFDSLAGFTNVGAGGLSITDAQATGLTVTSAVDAGTGATLTLATSAGPLTLAANLTATGGTVDLASAGVLSQTAGVITTATLTGSSVGAASLADANLFASLAGFTNTGVGNVSITDAKASGLTVTASLNAGANNTLTLSTANGGPLTLAADLFAPGGTVDLVSAGVLTQPAGVIIASSFAGSAVGGAALTNANQLASLNGFTNAGAGDFAITDAAASGLTVATDIVVGAGHALTLTTTGGPLMLGGNLTAGGGTVTLASSGAIDQTGGVITTGVLKGASVGGANLADANLIGTLTGFGNLDAGAITLVNSANLVVAGAVDNTLGAPGGVGRDVSVTLTAGSLTGAGVFTAARDVALQAVGGSLSFASATAGDDVVLRAAAGVTVTGTLAATGTASPSEIADPTGAGNVQAASAPVTLFGQTYASLTDGSHVDVRTAVGDITLTGVATAVGDVRLQTLSGAIHTGNVTAGRTIILDAATTVDRGGAPSNNLSAGVDLAVQAGSGPANVGGVTAAAGDVVLRSAGGAVTLASASAGDDLVVRAATGVTVAGALTSGTGVDGAGLADVFLADKPSQAMNVFGHIYASLSGGSPIDIVAFSGPIVLGGPAQARGGDIRLQALAGSIAYAGLSADSDVLIADGTGIAGGAVVAGGDVAISGAAVTVGALTAGDDIVVRTPGALIVNGALSSGLGGDRVGAGDYLGALSSLSVFHAPDTPLTGGSTVDIGAAAVAISGPTTANGVGSDVRIVTSGQDGAQPALTVMGAISAGRDVALDSLGGGVMAGAITAGRDVAARATMGSITLVSAAAGDDVVLVAPGGSVNLDGSVTATGGASTGIGQTLFATVSSALDGLFTLGSQSIFVGAVSYANKGYGPNHPATLTAGKAVGLALSDPTGLSLSDPKPDGGSWVMDSTLLAPTVSLFESKGNINVGAATVNGPVTKLNLYTPALVSVTGQFAPATDNTVSVAIGDPAKAVWTPSQIDVINDGGGGPNAGSIGFTSVNAAGVYSTSPKTFDTAALYAVTDILLGDQNFVTANAAVTNIAAIKQIDPSRPVPPTNASTSKAVMLAVGDLTMAAGSLIVQQNTTGLRTSDGTGYYVTRTLTLGAFGPFPPAIDLFGVFVKPGTTIPITGPAAADVNQIFLLPDLVDSPYRALYRVNSCVIGELGNCTPTSDGMIAIPLDELSRGSLLSRDELDLEDPTITGAPNEEIWRRTVDSQ